MDLELAQKLALETDYACEAVGEEINTADAAAFFLEGYEYAQKQVKNNGDLSVVSNLLKAEDTDVPFKDYIEKYYELVTLDRIYKSKNSDEHITESKLIAQYKRAYKL